MVVNYENVSIYQADECILSGVNLRVDEGEFVYIIGKVGAGKSSLLKTLYCELDIPLEGDVTADVLGRNLLTLKRRGIPALRKEMGIIFQDFQLLHDRDVYQNLRFVLRSTGWKHSDEIDERIDKVLADVEMCDKKNKRPHELSGGEQQRIAIARAMLNSPKLIIADEPTGNLDPATADNIVELLRKATDDGAAVVMSTHNLPMLSKYPGTVYKCENGTFKKEEGQPTEGENQSDEEADDTPATLQ